MTYRPAEEFFGPPLLVRLPSFVHMAISLAVVALVVVVERGPQDSALYRYMFRQSHLIDAHVVAGAFILSGIASILRAGMRGVRVRGDWLEYRDLVGALVPKVRRIRWAQIDQINFEPSGAISLNLWDGTSDLLPGVSDERGLGLVLERVALARAIPVRGGSGLDDLDDPGLDHSEDEA